MRQTKTIYNPKFDFTYKLFTPGAKGRIQVHTRNELTEKQQLAEKKKFAKRYKVDLETVTIEPCDRPKILHAVEEPAVVEYYNSGQIMNEQWWHMGQRHREDGPATIRYNSDGSIKCKSYYLYGKIIPQQVWDGIKNASCS